MAWRGRIAQTISCAPRAPDILKIDQSATASVGEAVLTLGNDRFGANVMKLLVVQELERRRREVEATGESAWCSYQRSSMIGDGLAQLFR
jgi:hypothetical protein